MSKYSYIKMPIRYPPMAALRAFEAASRHLSYTKAAAELNVTQSAVSHQIKHMESLWGFKLFERQGRQVVLTQHGRAIVPVIYDFLSRLTSTLEDFQDNDNNNQGLRVSLLQSLAIKWLVPRLGHFNYQYPDIDVWIATTTELKNNELDNADIGIRLGYGNWHSVFEELLFTEYAFPVCSARFRASLSDLHEPADLLNKPLLRRSTFDITPRWRDWFKAAGVAARAMPKGTTFPSSSLAVQGAIDDQGIALARTAHVLDDLKSGRLVHLFPEVRLRSNVSYYFICPIGREHEPALAHFRNWLKREVAATMRESGDLLETSPLEIATS